MGSAEARAGHRCDAGLHYMDPNWDTCPYCEAEKRSKERTKPEVFSASSERRTRVGESPSAEKPSSRMTKEMPSSDEYGPSVGGEERRIVGVLVTYTWQTEGQLFPIREGKNYIGAGEVSSEPTHRPCDIQISYDSEMSLEHALILVRRGHYDIIDQKSSNGTFLDGEMIPISGTALGNYQEIKTGATVWTFIRIEPPLTKAKAPTPKQPKTSEQPKPPRGPITEVP